MSEDQLFLLASVFAARRDKEHLVKLLPCFAEKADFYNVVGALWPEMDDPTQLKFLFEVDCGQIIDSRALVIELIDSDDKLIPMVEMDASVLRERSRTTKEYIETRMNDVPNYTRFSFGSFEAAWMRKRMILCNRLTPEETTSYRPLWAVASADSGFGKWIQGVVQPLEHINKRLGRAITIEEFESMEPMSVFELTLKTEPEFPSTVIHREVIPYLENLALYDIFLSEIFGETYFPLNSASNIRNFSHLFEELLKASSDSGIRLRVQVQAAQIIFENSSNLLKDADLSSIRDLLSRMDDKVKVGNYDITVALLKDYTKFMDYLYKSFSLKEIYSISQEESLGQLAHFSAIIRDQILNRHSGVSTMGAILQLMEISKPEDEQIFKNLTMDQKTSVFIETVLEMGNFELLADFLTKVDSGVDEDVLEKYFWHFFNKASNGLKSRPEMRNARKTLDLLLGKNFAKYSHLNALLEVSNDLSTYSLNLGKGIPFKPSDILSFATRIFDLITLLMELNPQLYEDMATTLKIAEKLQIGLNLKKQDTPVSSETLAKILVLHIDHSLANLDFGFALDGTRELLKMKNISSFWPTIFQVGKFVDPRWPDGEAPLDILVVQLEILGDLLQLCPVEEAEAVVSQWSAIEVELITRDPSLARLSAKGPEGPSSYLQKNMLSGVSQTLSSFLSDVEK